MRSEYVEAKTCINVSSIFQAIGYTLAPYYDRMDDNDVLHVFYNDEVRYQN